MEYWRFKILGEEGLELGWPFAERMFIDWTNIDIASERQYNRKLRTELIEMRDIVLKENSYEVDFIKGGIERGGFGFLVSQKTLEVLENFKLPPHQLYSVKVKLREKYLINDYYWLHIVGFYMNEHIDFEHSEIVDLGTGVFVNSLSKLKMYTSFDSSQNFRMNKVYFSNNMDYDLFALKGIGYFYWISQDLKVAIEDANLKGIYPMQTCLPFERRSGRYDN